MSQSIPPTPSTGYQPVSPETPPPNETTKKVEKLAGITLKNVGDSLYKSVIFKRVVVTAAVLVTAGFLGSPPGWFVAAGLVGILAISLLLNKDKTLLELGVLKRVLLGGLWNEIPLVTQEPSKEFQTEVRINASSPTPSFISPRQEGKEGTLYLGGLPNKLSKQSRDLFLSNAPPSVVLSVVEDWELEARSASIPYSTEELQSANIDFRQIIQKDHEPLSVETLNEAADYIYDAISSGRDIYVHCKAGQGRSTMAVAAYLIKYKQMNALEAINHISQEGGRRMSNTQKKIPNLEEFAKLFQIRETLQTTDAESLQQELARSNRDYITISFQNNPANTKTKKQEVLDYLLSLPSHILPFLKSEAFAPIVQSETAKWISRLAVTGKAETLQITATELKDGSWRIEGSFVLEYRNISNPDPVEATSTIYYSVTVPREFTENQEVPLTYTTSLIPPNMSTKLEKFLKGMQNSDSDSALERIQSLRQGQEFALSFANPKDKDLFTEIQQDLRGTLKIVIQKDGATTTFSKENLPASLEALRLPPHFHRYLVQNLHTALIGSIGKDIPLFRGIDGIAISKIQGQEVLIELQKESDSWQFLMKFPIEFYTANDQGKQVVDSAEIVCTATLSALEKTYQDSNDPAKQNLPLTLTLRFSAGK